MSPYLLFHRPCSSFSLLPPPLLPSSPQSNPHPPFLSPFIFLLFLPLFTLMSPLPPPHLSFPPLVSSSSPLPLPSHCFHVILSLHFSSSTFTSPLLIFPLFSFLFFLSSSLSVLPFFPHFLFLLLLLSSHCPPSFLHHYSSTCSRSLPLSSSHLILFKTSSLPPPLHWPLLLLHYLSSPYPFPPPPLFYPLHLLFSPLPLLFFLLLFLPVPSPLLLSFLLSSPHLILFMSLPLRSPLLLSLLLLLLSVSTFIQRRLCLIFRGFAQCFLIFVFMWTFTVSGKSF